MALMSPLAAGEGETSLSPPQTTIGFEEQPSPPAISFTPKPQAMAFMSFLAAGEAETEGAEAEADPAERGLQ